MKKLCIPLLIVCPIFAAASVPAFPEGKIELPLLSVAESARQALPAPSAAPVAPIRGHAVYIVPKESLVSYLPIHVPTDEIDPQMVRTPTAGPAYKLIVKTPAIEPAR